MAAELLYSDPLVDLRRDQTLDLLATLPNDGPAVVLGLSMLPEGTNAGIDSYLRQLKRYTDSLKNAGGNIAYVGARCETTEEGVTTLRAYAGRPGASLIMTPTASPSQLAPLLDALAEDSTRDGDGMTAAGRMYHLPATPNAERAVAEMAVGELEAFDPQRVAFIGAGAVNLPLIEQLSDRGRAPGTIVTKENSSEIIPTLHSRADLIISATGIAGLLTPQSLLRTRADGKNPAPLTVVDSGVSINKLTGITHGDVDPHMYGYNGEQPILISGAPVIYPDGTVLHRGRGVGRLTVATFVLQGLAASLGANIESPLTALASRN